MQKWVGVVGSLRQASYNRALLEALKNVLPSGVELELVDLRGIPVYDGDLETQGLPEAVGALDQKLAAADAIVIATPEYNYSIPGCLKNAIDWISRTPTRAFAGKPTAILGASMGALGTARAQYHLRQVLVYLDAFVMNRPEVFVGAAHTKFSEGRLSDEPTREVLKNFGEALQTYVRRLSAS